MIAAAAAALVAVPVAAQSPSLGDAIATGAVGERFDGYLGIAAAVTPTVRSQVAGINIQRRTLFSNLAASKRVSPGDIAITAGCQLLARTGVGQAYMLSDGKWRRRGAGEAPPQPDYCR